MQLLLPFEHHWDQHLMSPHIYMMGMNLMISSSKAECTTCGCRVLCFYLYCFVCEFITSSFVLFCVLIVLSCYLYSVRFFVHNFALFPSFICVSFSFNFHSLSTFCTVHIEFFLSLFIVLSLLSFP